MIKQLFSGFFCVAALWCGAENLSFEQATLSPKTVADSFRKEMSDKGAILTFSLKQTGSSTVSIPVDPAKVAGREVVFSVWMRLENISKKPKAWNGVKFMAAYTDAKGKMQYPQCQITVDTAPWNKFYLTVKFPPKPGATKLVLGLEEVSGTVQFRDLAMDVKAE